MSPHKLRHSFAADFIRNGGSIVLLRDQLGHSNIETTSLYTNLSNKDNEQVLTRMETSRLKRTDTEK
ncbi:site-specific recombinase XerD [Planomicrobium stackebrandtii]|uniref:Site-specific recombinase XerD n=1 Tax=Planomicrobium stackebrandtii TaxID=253160 RepID=A0ABU0GP98_9BACL|nr:tyrosine-type recombinase/integrase [Planomicrobium stackebrandtii]MDQ0427187.1 site-specific recombinase XerD [Planomicrobium stackebrandtii]